MSKANNYNKNQLTIAPMPPPFNAIMFNNHIGVTNGKLFKNGDSKSKLSSPKPNILSNSRGLVPFNLLNFGDFVDDVDFRSTAESSSELEFTFLRVSEVLFLC